MQIAVIYLRVSSEEQAESRNGLEAQLDACRAYAARHHLSIASEPFVDAGLSGTLPIHQRPALLDALAALPATGVLLVAKRDRLARDHDRSAIPLIEALVRKRRARIISAAGEGTDGDPNDPAQWIQRVIIDAFAGYEALQASFRTRAALRARRRRQLLAGALPFGWRLRDGTKVETVRKGRARLVHQNPEIEPDPDEQHTLIRIKEMKTQGMSNRKIAARLRDERVPTKRGGTWHHATIASVLASDARGSPV